MKMSSKVSVILGILIALPVEKDASANLDLGYLLAAANQQLECRAAETKPADQFGMNQTWMKNREALPRLCYGQDIKNQSKLIRKVSSSHLDIADTVNSVDSLSLLTAVLEASGLAKILKESGPYTLFAPTNEAFNKLPTFMLENLVSDNYLLKRVLAYHIVWGEYYSSDLSAIDSLVSIEGSKIHVAGIRISERDIATRNGVIQIVDKVMVPQM